jgi:hypothetical protein
MTDPRLASLERDSPLAARLAELASVAVRVDAGLLRRLRRTLLPEAPPAIEADLWFSAIVEARSASGFQIAPGLLGELRRRLTLESGRPPIADVRRVTAEAHERVSPLIALEERINGLALEQGAAARTEIEEALRPALSVIAGGGADAMRVARWAQSAAARFHPIVLDTAPARGLVIGASLLLRLRPKVSGGPLNTATTIADIAWALPAIDAETKVSIDVSLVAGGLQFTEPATGGATIDVPSTEPRMVEIEWTGADGAQHRLVDAKPGVFVALAGSPADVTVTTLTGDQYRVAVSDGTAQQSRGVWAPPPDDLLMSCEQLFDPVGRHPIGVAFALEPELFLTARRIVDGMTTVPVAESRPPLPPMTVMPWELGESDEGHDDELVPLRQNNVSMEVLEIAEPAASSGQAAAVGFLAGGARWFECVVEQEPSSWSVVRGALIDPPALFATELTAAFVGAPVVVDREVIGAILSVTPPAEGQTHAVVELATPEYLQSVVIRARAKNRQTPTSGLKFLILSNMNDLVEEREILVRAITSAGHQIVEGQSDPELAPGYKRLSGALEMRAANAFIVLVGNQYGAVVPGDAQHRSEIEIDYDDAIELGKPCLVFMLADDYSSKIEQVDWGSGSAQFRSKVRQRSPQLRTFRTREELQQHVAAALAELRSNQTAQRPSQPNAPPAQHAADAAAPEAPSTAAGYAFISFNSKDAIRVEEISDRLQAAGIEVWLDRRRLALGDEWDARIQKAIEDAAVFIPVLSQSAMQSEWVKREIGLAVERAKTKTSDEPFILPLVIDPLSDMGRDPFLSLMNLQWVDATHGVPAPFIDAVLRVVKSRSAKAPSERRMPAGSRLFGVPTDPVPLVGRADLLRDLTQLLKAREVSGAKVEGSRPNVLSLVGPDGIGKWTLANHAALAVADAFPDGVIWLGEDGSGYPRRNLRSYAEARSVPALFKSGSGVNEIIDQDRFREEFAPRRVLFVADQRFTSDIIPTVMMAGPECVVLRLVNDTAMHKAGRVMNVPAFSVSESQELLDRTAGHPVKEQEILSFGASRPLFLRLLGNGVRWTSEADVVEAIRVSRKEAQNSLLESPIRAMIRLFGQVPERRRAIASLPPALMKERPLTTHSLDREVLKVLTDLGLVEIHGEFVRLHRLIEPEVYQLS